jgi:hypothetical protein
MGCVTLTHGSLDRRVDANQVRRPPRYIRPLQYRLQCLENLLARRFTVEVRSLAVKMSPGDVNVSGGIINDDPRRSGLRHTSSPLVLLADDSRLVATLLPDAARVCEA